MFSTFQDNQATIKELLQMVYDKIESSNVPKPNGMLTFHHINVRPIFIVAVPDHAIFFTAEPSNKKVRRMK